MSSLSAKKHGLVMAGVVSAVCVAGLIIRGQNARAIVNNDRSRDPTAQTTSSAPPPASSSEYCNTRTDAGYIGSQACERCHPDTYQSYQQTMMSRSMAEVDPAIEPA